MRLTNKEQNDLRKELDKQESAHIRMKRRKFNQKDFETVKIIGRGAFGEVCIITLLLFVVVAHYSDLLTQCWNRSDW